MFDKDFVLEKIDLKYDKVTGMDKKRTITIDDVIANDCVRFYPECNPEYYVTFRDMGGKIMKVEVDMSDFDNPEKITFYRY